MGIVLKIIIVGDGKVGFTLAQHLSRENHDVTIIDTRDDALRRANDTLDVMCVKGNGASITTLRESGADTADVLIAATNADEVNMVCCLTAKRLGTKYTIARVRDMEYTAELSSLKREMGIDMIINPENATAVEISRLLRFPSAANIDTFYRGRVELIGFRVQADDFICSQPLSALPGKPGLIVALDSGDAGRLGEELQTLLKEVPVVNIDHHQGNPGYGSAANWVDPAMSATGEMVGHLAEALGLSLEGALAEAVYVALASDTGSFSYGNTRASTLRMAARLLEGGLDIASVRARLDNNWSESKLRLWGRLMSEARILDNGKLGVSIVSRALLRECGASREDAEGFVEQLRKIRGVRVALLLREEEREGSIMTKVSLRSSGADDVRKVAAQFGGGGHKNAAGATVDLPPEKTLTVIQPYIRHVWN